MSVESLPSAKHPPLVSVALILIAVAGALALGGLISAGSDDAWYARLNKPPLNPPDITFAIVWPVLYALMGIGAMIVRFSVGSWHLASAALGIFFTQLAVNVGWSYAFFGYHEILLSMGILAALWLLIVMMIRAFAKHSMLAALLQLPYLAWVTFAGYLNGFILAGN